MATLPANNSGYTAIVRGANGGTGIGVVEAYDLDTAANSKLANISTRGFVQPGDNVLIAGTIVVGQTPQKVLIRSIGPSLSIPGKVADPTLELRDGNGGLIEANDNWKDSPNKQAINDSTIPPANDFESAIVATLPANNAFYTAIVRGVGGTTGIAVVEAYALEPQGAVTLSTAVESWSGNTRALACWLRRLAATIFVWAVDGSGDEFFPARRRWGKSSPRRGRQRQHTRRVRSPEMDLS